MTNITHSKLVAALAALVSATLPFTFASEARAEAKFDVIVVAESYGKNGKPEIHTPFVLEGKKWLDKLAADKNFTVTYVDDPNSFTDEVLSRYELIFQMNYTPWRWTPTAKAAFEKYIGEGRGGWIGLHHALLFGRNVTPKNEALWDWFFKFMGEINFKSYIPEFAEGTVHLEKPAHPIFKGVPKSFVVTKDEWYTFDKSPRPNVTVLANVDESSYKPDTKVKMGDHPVIWTNEKYKGKNLFIFMGHHPNHFTNPAYTTLLTNSILWAASKK
ncbi:MAG TPA: ThuA domain-containing protein [Polyangia bacterium]